MTEARESITGKVAEIFSDREVFLNIGSEDGVDVGMKFVIMSKRHVNILDPDTNEVIGAVPVPKTIVKVVRVDGPHLAAARTFRTIKGNPGAFNVLSGTPDRVETLDISSGTSLLSRLSDEELRIQKGDIARETRGDEYDDL